MSYKIAIATSDGLNVDQHFGSAKRFVIFSAKEKNYYQSEVRTLTTLPTNANSNNGCGGCSSGCESTHKCGNANSATDAVALLADCRCIVCAKMGGNIYKQFESKAITVFEIEMPINDVLSRITTYYNNIDQRRARATQNFS